MRLAVDTNVFVSAALKANSSPFAVVRWIDRHDGLLKSAATEEELLQVLQRPRIAAVTDPAFHAGMLMLLAHAELVLITRRIAACRDPHDDKFLELAVNGGAEILISGDKDLAALHPFEGIPIVSPAEFVRAVSG
jgi:putative PIN family toxin of toxin-antitoxin system